MPRQWTWMWTRRRSACMPQHCMLSKRWLAKSEQEAKMDTEPAQARSRDTAERMAESWRMFMAEETSQPITQRWEWHAWHFFLALLPAYGIYKFAEWGESYMDKAGAELEALQVFKKRLEAEIHSRQTREPDPTTKEIAELTRRLQLVEEQFKSLQSRAAASDVIAHSGAGKGKNIDKVNDKGSKQVTEAE